MGMTRIVGLVAAAVLLGAGLAPPAHAGGCEAPRRYSSHHHHHHSHHHHRSYSSYSSHRGLGYRGVGTYGYSIHAGDAYCRPHTPRYGGHRGYNRFGDAHHYGYTGHRYTHYPQRRWGAHHTYQHKRYLRSGGTYQSNLYYPRYGNWAYRPDWVYEGFPPPADYVHPVPEGAYDAPAPLEPIPYQPGGSNLNQPPRNVFIIDGEIYTPDDLNLRPQHWKYFKPHPDDQDNPEIEENPEQRWPAPQLARGWELLEAGDHSHAMSAFGEIATASMGNAEAKVGFALAAAMGESDDTAAWAMKRAILTNPRALDDLRVSDAMQQRCARLIDRYQRAVHQTWSESDARFMLASLHYLAADLDSADTVIASITPETMRYDRGARVMAGIVEHRLAMGDTALVQHDSAQSFANDDHRRADIRR